MTGKIILAWLAVTGVWTFALFGLDKWRAGRGAGTRTAESSLLLACALGGWPGGLLGMLLFRHKSAKPSFQLKFAAALLVWMALVAVALRLAGRS
jgi:uncharacterized membrane protein YsdA (DUF1294 family)